MKISLEDTFSNREVVVSIDSAIEVILIKIFENWQNYPLSQLVDAFKLVKISLLCYIDSDIDLDYITARIIGATSQGMKELDQEINKASQMFNSKRRNMHGSFLARGSEVHAFEKILRCLLFACSLPKDQPNSLVVCKKALKFIEWVTQYFTLMFICKDGRLTETREDEVSPLKFIETIFAFHLYNIRNASTTPRQSSSFEGANICLEKCVELLCKIFKERPEVLSKLEIVSILIKRICHMAYD